MVKEKPYILQTYVTNKQTGDSAATAVAMFTGVKTTYKTVGYDNKVVRGKPSTHKIAEELSGILSWAQESGMKTGFVTNSRLTHATPAALYAHSANRDWECDAFVNRKKVHSSEKVPSPQEVKIQRILFSRNDILNFPDIFLKPNLKLKLHPCVNKMENICDWTTFEFENIQP